MINTFVSARRYLLCTIVLIALLVAWGRMSPAHGAEEPEDWGIAMGVRSARIPFDSEIKTVNDVAPLIYYENGRLFIHGGEAGYRLINGRHIQISPLVRFRFFDIPAEYQNEVREDGADFGGQFTYTFDDPFHIDFEVMSDEDGRWHTNLTPTLTLNSGRWETETLIRLRFKSKDFNNRYYGLDIERPGSAADLMLGAQFKYHVVSNLYLLCKATVTFLDPDTKGVEFINQSTTSTLFAGFGFFKEKHAPAGRQLASTPYVRLAHGLASRSSLGKIITFQGKNDEYGNTLTSLFFGIPLSDTLLTLPIATYLTPGLVIHPSSEVQDDALEYVLAVKFYHTFKWPCMWRFGFAEGLSYVTQVPYVERRSLERDGYRPSRLLNYLDFSIDLEIGKLIRVSWLENWWLGYSIHHRSGIFSTSSAFGRISGGSNYNTLYVQYHW